MKMWINYEEDTSTNNSESENQTLRLYKCGKWTVKCPFPRFFSFLRTHTFVI